MKLIINNLVIILVTIVLIFCLLALSVCGSDSKYRSNKNRSYHKPSINYAYSSSLVNESPEYITNSYSKNPTDLHKFRNETRPKLIGGGQLVKIKENRKCKNGYIGLKQHPRHKQYYYICQRDRILLGRCANNKIYNDTKKYCVSKSRSLPPTAATHGSERKHKFNVSQCSASGIFPIEGKIRYYYTCIYLRGRFIQKISKCPRGTLFNSTTGTCVERSKNQPCHTPGAYRVADNSDYYYKCCVKNDGEYYQVKLKCPLGKSFDISSEECVSNSDDLDYFSKFPKQSISKIIRHRKRDLMDSLPQQLLKRINSFDIVNYSDESQEETFKRLVNKKFCGCSGVNDYAEAKPSKGSFEFRGTKKFKNDGKIPQTQPKLMKPRSNYESGYAVLVPADRSYGSCAECISNENVNNITATHTVPVAIKNQTKTTKLKSLVQEAQQVKSAEAISSGSTKNKITKKTKINENELATAESTPSAISLNNTLIPNPTNSTIEQRNSKPFSPMPHHSSSTFLAATPIATQSTPYSIATTTITTVPTETKATQSTINTLGTKPNRTQTIKEGAGQPQNEMSGTEPNTAESQTIVTILKSALSIQNTNSKETEITTLMPTPTLSVTSNPRLSITTPKTTTITTADNIVTPLMLSTEGRTILIQTPVSSESPDINGFTSSSLQPNSLSTSALDKHAMTTGIVTTTASSEQLDTNSFIASFATTSADEFTSEDSTIAKAPNLTTMAQSYTTISQDITSNASRAAYTEPSTIKTHFSTVLELGTRNTISDDDISHQNTITTTAVPVEYTDTNSFAASFVTPALPTTTAEELNSKDVMTAKTTNNTAIAPSDITAPHTVIAITPIPTTASPEQPDIKSYAASLVTPSILHTTTTAASKPGIPTTLIPDSIENSRTTTVILDTTSNMSNTKESVSTNANKTLVPPKSISNKTSETITPNKLLTKSLLRIEQNGDKLSSKIMSPTTEVSITELDRSTNTISQISISPTTKPNILPTTKLSSRTASTWDHSSTENTKEVDISMSHSLMTTSEQPVTNSSPSSKELTAQTFRKLLIIYNISDIINSSNETRSVDQAILNATTKYTNISSLDDNGSNDKEDLVDRSDKMNELGFDIGITTSRPTRSVNAEKKFNYNNFEFTSDESLGEFVSVELAETSNETESTKTLPLEHTKLPELTESEIVGNSDSQESQARKENKKNEDSKDTLNKYNLNSSDYESYDFPNNSSENESSKNSSSTDGFLVILGELVDNLKINQPTENHNNSLEIKYDDKNSDNSKLTFPTNKNIKSSSPTIESVEKSKIKIIETTLNKSVGPLENTSSEKNSDLYITQSEINNKLPEITESSIIGDYESQGVSKVAEDHSDLEKFAHQNSPADETQHKSGITSDRKNSNENNLESFKHLEILIPRETQNNVTENQIDKNKLESNESRYKSNTLNETDRDIQHESENNSVRKKKSIAGNLNSTEHLQNIKQNQAAEDKNGKDPKESNESKKNKTNDPDLNKFDSAQNKTESTAGNQDTAKPSVEHNVSTSKPHDKMKDDDFSNETVTPEARKNHTDTRLRPVDHIKVTIQTNTSAQNKTNDKDAVNFQSVNNKTRNDKLSNETVGANKQIGPFEDILKVNTSKGPENDLVNSKARAQNKTSDIVTISIQSKDDDFSNETVVPEASNDAHVTVKIDNGEEGCLTNEFGHNVINTKIVVNPMPTKCSCVVEPVGDQCQSPSDSKKSDVCCYGSITNGTSDSGAADISLCIRKQCKMHIKYAPLNHKDCNCTGRSQDDAGCIKEKILIFN